MRLLLQFSACFALGLFVAVLILVGLMFAGEMGLIEGWLLTGQPLAGVFLKLLPGEFWLWLTGVRGAADNPSVRSFLAMCMALAQAGLLLALPLHYGLRRA